MDRLADRIDAYPALSKGERAEVERAVAAAPEWAGALREAQRFAGLLDAARPAPPGEPEAEAAERVRLRDLAAGAEDPARKFERLTGRALPAVPPRPAPPRWSGAGRGLAGALAAFALVGGGLAAASAVATPERARVADLAALAHVGPVALGGGELAVPLAVAFGHVAEAGRARPGRARSYDPAALARAAADLGRIAARAPEDSAVRQEAGLARGRVLLWLGRDAEAARALGALVRAGGYRAPEARRLLDWLRTGGPSERAGVTGR